MKEVNRNHDLKRRLERQIWVVEKKGKAREGGPSPKKSSEILWIPHFGLAPFHPNPCSKVAVGPLALPLQIHTHIHTYIHTYTYIHTNK